MSEPTGKPLPLPSAWRDQGLDHSRPVEGFAITHVREIDEHGIAIRYKPRRLLLPILGSLAFVGVMLALVLAIGPRLMFDPTYRTFWNFLAFIVFMVGLVFFVFLLIEAVVHLLNGSRRVALLTVCPSGIYHRQPGWTAYFPWVELLDIRALSNQGDKTQPPQRILLYADDEKLYVTDRRRIPYPRFQLESPGNREIYSSELAVVDVALPYWALRFYHQNPEHRRELGTDAALRRFENGDFPCDQEAAD